MSRRRKERERNLLAKERGWEYQFRPDGALFRISGDTRSGLKWVYTVRELDGGISRPGEWTCPFPAATIAFMDGPIDAKFIAEIVQLGETLVEKNDE